MSDNINMAIFIELFIWISTEANNVLASCASRQALQSLTGDFQ